MPNEGTGGVLDEKKFKELLKPIIDSVNTINEGQKGLALEVQGIKEGALKPTDGDPDPTPTSDRDLEGMSRKDFMGQIMEEVGKVVKESVKPVSQKIDAKSEKDLETEVNKAVTVAAKAHKDFWEFKDEMGKELVANPYLMPEDAYQLARLHNAEKATEMDKKHPSEEAIQKEKDDNEAAENPPPFALTPTSSQTEPTEKMKLPEASELAWSETASHLDK